MKFFFILCIIVLFYYFGKIVLSYIDTDGTVMGGGNCKNNDGISILQKAGVFGNLHIKCSDEDESSKTDEEEPEEDEEEKKEKSWRSRY